jgi:hypothetical protein
MKINCGPTRDVKLKMLRAWHPWFAWRPVRVGESDCRWLEYVERREVSKDRYDAFLWEYRPLTKG